MMMNNVNQIIAKKLSIAIKLWFSKCKTLNLAGSELEKVASNI